MKIAVVGAGNGGSFTALHFGWYTRTNPDVEVELIYNPETKPERVGQNHKRDKTKKERDKR